MKVTTGGVTVGVGVLIVGTLSVAAVMTVRDENNHRDDCQPQSFEVASAASVAFEDEYLHSSREDPPTRSGTTVMPSDQARETLDKVATQREWSRSGYVVIVDYDPVTDAPSPPSCLSGTPILYVDGGRRQTG